MSLPDDWDEYSPKSAQVSWQRRLKAIVEGCKQPGWNSYKAKPVTDEAIAAAHHLCNSLDVIPTTDGGIEIAMAAEAISIRIHPDGRIENVYVDIHDAEETIQLWVKAFSAQEKKEEKD